MNRKLKIKLRKLKIFLRFILLQSFFVFVGVFPWMTLDASVDKLVSLLQWGNLVYMPNLLLFAWQIFLILAKVFFGVICVAILVFEIGVLAFDLFKVLRSENKKEALQRFSRFYKAIIFG